MTKSKYFPDPSLPADVAGTRLQASYEAFTLETAVEALKQYVALTGDQEVTEMRIKLTRKLEAI